jgi:sulfate transport system ATP-binding protein
VFRNVAFGLEVRKKGKDEIRKRVMELLELVHLDQFAERLPSQLSGGQRQRMALARALAVEPDVLLLDEPFGALDAQVRKELRAWLRRLHDEVHVTTVFVTHDQEEAIEISDDVVVLAGGRIVQSGAPATLYDNPKDEFVMRFLGPVTQLGGRLVRPHDLELSLTRTTDAVPATVRRIVKLGFEVRVDLQEPSGRELSAQLTRASSAQLDLAPGREVYVRLTPGARSLQLAG